MMSTASLRVMAILGHHGIGKTTQRLLHGQEAFAPKVLDS